MLESYRCMCYGVNGYCAMGAAYRWKTNDYCVSSRTTFSEKDLTILFYPPAGNLCLHTPKELVACDRKGIEIKNGGLTSLPRHPSGQRHRSTPFHHTSRSHSSKQVLAHCRLVHQREPNCLSSRAAATEKDFP